MFALTLNFIRNIPNVDFMVILMKFATCHVRNAFKRPLRPNAPTVRVLTSVILKEIEWAFRKLYPSKIPGMVHQGLLAPEGLKGSGMACYIVKTNCFQNRRKRLDGSSCNFYKTFNITKCMLDLVYFTSRLFSSLYKFKSNGYS